MGDMRELLFELIGVCDWCLEGVCVAWGNLIDVYTYQGFVVKNSRLYFQFPFNIVLFFSLKFLLVINFLILVRGGTPRYRYDYLTKLGWLKFLSFVLIMFFISLFFFFLF